MSRSEPLRCICITDIHGDLPRFKAILAQSADADAILLGGDLTNFGKPPIAETVVKLAQEVCPFVVAVAGNCDSPEIDARLTELGVSVFGVSQSFGPLGIYGVSAMPPWLGTMYELSEADIQRSLESGQKHLCDNQPANSIEHEIVLSHPPPYESTVDRTHSGQSAGSRAVKEWIAQQQPTLVVCGHIHEARGIEKIGSTTVVNCGPAFLGHYAEATFETGESQSVEVQLRTADA